MSIYFLFIIQPAFPAYKSEVHFYDLHSEDFDLFA